MNDIQIQLAENATEKIREHVIGGLVAYNKTHAGAASHTGVTVVARAGDEIVAGLLGHTNWEWLFVAQLWVSDAVRKQGVGRRLMEAAETEAVRRGCKHAHVDTFSFQALSFYERLGYTVFGQLDDYPQGHTRYFLQKRDLSRVS